MNESNRRKKILYLVMIPSLYWPLLAISPPFEEFGNIWQFLQGVTHCLGKLNVVFIPEVEKNALS